MITPRTECILQNICCNTVADIGTDHAYIPIALIQRNICKKVIATDIREGPVKMAINNIKKYGLSDKIEVRLGNGLECIAPDECEQAVIAGMGGNMICEILSKNISNHMLFVLQPMNCQYELRKYLYSNNYIIIKEDIAVEGFKVYNIICAKKGLPKNKTKDIYYHVPEELINHKYFKNLLNKKRREFLKIINGNKKSQAPNKALIYKYENLLKELETLY